MKTIIDAINELIKGANIAQGRGVYSLKEASDVYMAIDFINVAITNQQQTTQTPIPPIVTDTTVDAPVNKDLDKQYGS